MYTIEGYPEFGEDVKTIFKEFTFDNGFEIKQNSPEEVFLISQNCIIQLHLGVDQRVFYFFVNPRTNNRFDYITLQIFFGIPFDRNLVGGENYPLSSDEWTNFYSEENNRAICQVDLPIILDEIKNNWMFLINGDFSFEEDFEEWKKWYEKKRSEGIPHNNLSYDQFLRSHS